MTRAFFEKYCPELLDKGFAAYIHIGASNHVAIRSSRILDPDIPELFAVNAYKEIANLLIKAANAYLDSPPPEDGECLVLHTAVRLFGTAFFAIRQAWDSKRYGKNRAKAPFAGSPWKL